jgi:CRP/FNR family transcriptional regulator
MTIGGVAAPDTAAKRQLRIEAPIPHFVTPPSACASAALGSRCEECRFRATCLGHAFRSVRSVMEPLVGYRRHLEAGEVLYHAGAKCSLLHVVQAGFFKTLMLSDDGIEQIAGFQMPGDLLGMDGFSSGVHWTDAIALTPASVCVISRARLLRSTVDNEPLCRHLFEVLSDQIIGDHATMLLLGSRSAEERVAGFLVELSERLSARGYSGSVIGLWMSREDIGRYLGLELETVSRVMSSLVRRQLIEVRRRQIEIPDLPALRQAVGGDDDAHSHARHAPGAQKATALA